MVGQAATGAVTEQVSALAEPFDQGPGTDVMGSWGSLQNSHGLRGRIDDLQIQAVLLHEWNLQPSLPRHPDGFGIAVDRIDATSFAVPSETSAVSDQVSGQVISQVSEAPKQPASSETLLGRFYARWVEAALLAKLTCAVPDVKPLTAPSSHLSS